MRLIKIGIGNVNPTVGAFSENINKIKTQAIQMAGEGCHIGVFGEHALAGYPCEDLIQWKSFVDQPMMFIKQLFGTAGTMLKNMVIIVGSPVRIGSDRYTMAAVIADQRIVGLVPKENLPDYSVFYDGRTITPGREGLFLKTKYSDIPVGDLIFQFGFGTLAVEVCEDLWRADGPMVRRCYSGAEIVCNLSASPFRIGMRETRREMINTRSADNCTTLVYANLVGGQDGLVYDGGGFVSQCGRMLCSAERWREGITTQVVDLDRVDRARAENTTWRRAAEAYLKGHEPVREITDQCMRDIARPNTPLPYPIPKNKSFFLPQEPETPKSARDDYFSDLEQAIGMAMRDYFQKTGVFKRYLIALSGGKDSCLTLLILYRALERMTKHLSVETRATFMKEMIWCVSMPSEFNSVMTQSISRRLCERLGVTFLESPIQEAVELEIAEQKKKLGVETLDATVIQNIQARIRANRMWNLANQQSGFWLQTGNMSEKAIGYTTIGGDMEGAFAPIANLPKTVVIEFVRWYRDQLGWIVLNDLLETKPSAELAANQEDEKDLMPYPVLDACFALFVGEKMSMQEVEFVLQQMWSDTELREMDPRFEPGTIHAWILKFARLFLGSIFKWVQTPLSVHLGSLDLERERALQLPVVQSKDWLGI